MTAEELLQTSDHLRLEAAARLDPDGRAERGQYFTRSVVAKLMASMLGVPESSSVRLLDAGAGTGSLIAALVAYLCSQRERPHEIEAVLYEPDVLLSLYLRRTIAACDALCQASGVAFSTLLSQSDFIADAVTMLKSENSLFGLPATKFDAAILNPPYRKIASSSPTRRMLSSIGIETTNYYTAFVWLSVRLLRDGGKLVAITPRSFCSGLYFKPFRLFIKNDAAIEQMHLYDSRTGVFSDDEVLQQSVIWQLRKGVPHTDATVLISSSEGPTDSQIELQEVPYEEVIHESDPEAFIHIPTTQGSRRARMSIRGLRYSLDKLGLSVSTGRVVDFRAESELRQQPSSDTAPLIYPSHFKGWGIVWPQEGKKPNAIVINDETRDLLIPSDIYVLVKRFSSKEEKRRVVSVVYDPKAVPSEWVGFENHLNYFHCQGRGLPVHLAYGLAGFLNSTVVDEYFRQFNGHTQVNATDLRNFSYPDKHTLISIGEQVVDKQPSQSELDDLVARNIWGYEESLHISSSGSTRLFEGHAGGMGGTSPRRRITANLHRATR